jgi:hypothetical protein
VLLGKGNDVPDNEEVVSKLGMFNYLQLIVKTLLYLWDRLGVVLRQALITEASQELVSILALRQLHLREVEATKLKLEVALFSNTLGVL